MSSSKNQSDLPCPDSNAHLTGSPHASSAQKKKHLPALLGFLGALLTFFKVLIPGSGNGSSTPALIRSWLKKSKTPSSTFDFMSLAGELRNKIYAEALASGTVSILVLSKEVYAEAKPIIYKAGVLKLGRGCIEELSPAPSEEELPLIQNIKVNIEQEMLYRSSLNDPNLSWYPWAALITPFMVDARLREMMGPFMNTASVSSRGTCEVIIRDFDKLERGKQQIKPVFSALRFFANFTKVIVTITANRGRNNWVVWLDEARESCMEELHGSLGRATWHAEDETFDESNHSNGYLVFRPRGSSTRAQGELVTE